MKLLNLIPNKKLNISGKPLDFTYTKVSEFNRRYGGEDDKIKKVPNHYWYWQCPKTKNAKIKKATEEEIKMYKTIMLVIDAAWNSDGILFL